MTNENQKSLAQASNISCNKCVDTNYIILINTITTRLVFCLDKVKRNCCTESPLHHVLAVFTENQWTVQKHSFNFV